MGRRSRGVFATTTTHHSESDQDDDEEWTSRRASSSSSSHRAAQAPQRPLPQLNTAEQLSRLRALGLTQYTESDLMQCLKDCDFNLDRAAERLLLGQFASRKTIQYRSRPKHHHHKSIRPAPAPRSSSSNNSNTPRDSGPAVKAPPPSSSSSSSSSFIPHTASKAARRKAPPPTVTPPTNSSCSSAGSSSRTAHPSPLRTESSCSTHTTRLIHNSKGRWLLCHRVLPNAICQTRNGSLTHEESLTVTPLFSAGRQHPIVHVRAQHMEGRLPDKLARLLAPLLMPQGRHPNHKKEPAAHQNQQQQQQQPYIRVDCQAYLDEQGLQMGEHVPVALTVWLMDPQRLFALFEHDNDDKSSGLSSQTLSRDLLRQRHGKSPPPWYNSSSSHPLRAAAFALLQWAQYGEDYTSMAQAAAAATQGNSTQTNHNDPRGDDHAVVELEEQEFETEEEEEEAETDTNRKDPQPHVVPEEPADWARSLPQADNPPGFTDGMELRPYQKQALYWMRRREVHGTCREQLQEELHLLQELAQEQEQGQPQLDAWTANDNDDDKAGIHCECGPVLVSAAAQHESTTLEGDCHPLVHPLWKTRYLASPDRTHAVSFYVQELLGLARRTPPAPPTPCSGGILADDMGLGKTVMLLGLVLQQKADDAARNDKDDDPPTSTTTTTLVVAKLSLLPQWEDEIRTKTNLTYRIYYGSSKDPYSQEELEGVDVVLTTYGTIQGEASQATKNKNKTKREAVLSSMAWRRVILDEAHCIRNQQTLASKVCCNLTAQHRWCVSGTIIQNSVADVYGILKFLHHEPWSIPSFWQKAIAKPLTTSATGGADLTEQERTEAFNLVLGRLRRVLAPLMLRRTKDSLTKDGQPILSLPPIETKVISVELSQPERDFYNALRARSVELFDGFVGRGEAAKSYFKILCLIARLRQACDHISLTVRSRLEDDDATLAASSQDEPHDTDLVVATSGAPSTPQQQQEESTVLGTNFLTELYDKIFTSPTPSSSKRKHPPNDDDDNNNNNSQEPHKRARQLSYASSVANTLSTAIAKNLTHVEEECPICLEHPRIQDAVLTPCAHIFCQACLVGVLKGQSATRSSGSKTKSVSSFHIPNGPCPLCNSAMESNKIIAMTKLDTGEYTTHFLTTPPSTTTTTKPGKSLARTSTLMDRNHHAGASAKLVLKASMEGTSDSSKLAAIVKELHAVWTMDPRSKIIVFSQFLGFLDLLQVRFQKEGIPFFRLDGKLSLHKRMKVLETFRSSSTAASSSNSSSNSNSNNSKNTIGTVLLMSMAAGAEGLNLVAASSVFLVDPWWNGARQDQCIHRIHRIGQTAAVVRVRQFIVRDSVEERMMELQRRKQTVAHELYQDVRQAGPDAQGLRLSLEDFKLIFQ